MNKKNNKVPDKIIEEMTQRINDVDWSFIQMIEEGKAEFAKWKAEQDAKKKEQSKVT